MGGKRCLPVSRVRSEELGRWSGGVSGAPACRRHGRRLDLCSEGAAEGPSPPSSGGRRARGPGPPVQEEFFVGPLPPAREPERPPNKGTSRRRGRRRSRSLSLGRRWTRRPSSPSLPRACCVGGRRSATLDAPARTSSPPKVQVTLVWSRGSRSRSRHEGP